MYKANLKRSLRGADDAQERDHVGFFSFDGELEGSAAVTAAQRVGDNSNASSRAEQSIEPVLRGHIRFDFQQKIASLQVSIRCSKMQRSVLTARDVMRGGAIFGIFAPRAGAERRNTTV